MSGFRFSHPIEVRYADLDPQRHVNNATLFSYLEQARARYLQALGLWGGDDFDAIGIIVAEASLRYLRPIAFGDAVEVETGVRRLGGKSFDFEYRVLCDREEAATGRVVLVAYDYRLGRSIPIPEAWRRTFLDFEGDALTDGREGGPRS